MTDESPTPVQIAERVCALQMARFVRQTLDSLTEISNQLRLNEQGSPRLPTDVDTAGLPQLFKQNRENLLVQSSYATAWAWLCDYGNVDGDLLLVSSGCFTEVATLLRAAKKKLNDAFELYCMPKHGVHLDFEVQRPTLSPGLLVQHARDAAKTIGDATTLLLKLYAYSRARIDNDEPPTDLVQRYRTIRNQPQIDDTPFSSIDLVTVHEVAEYLNVTDATIRNRIKEYNRSRSSKEKLQPKEKGRGRRPSRYLWGELREAVMKEQIEWPDDLDEGPGAGKPR